MNPKTPPSAVEIESFVLGAILLEPTAIVKVVEVLNEASFYKLANQIIYNAIVSLYTKGEPADLITLTEELRKQGELEKIGGEYYLTELATRVSSAANIEYHARILAERALLRGVIRLSQETISRAYDETEDALEVLNDLTVELTKIRSGVTKEKSVSLSVVAKETNEEVDNIHTGKSESLNFGFADIDGITGGARKGNLIIYAGLEKSGKSTMALQTIFYNAQKGIPCLFFSTEMSRIDLMLRYALIKEKISWLKLVQKKLSTLEIDKLKRQISILGKLPIYVSDALSTMLDITAESERMILDKGVRLITADYIQRLIPTYKKSSTNREQEIAGISRGLKDIAFKHKIFLVALSQLNEDLRSRESRAIEQDADKIITIDNPEKTEPTADGTGTITGIRIRQRFGAGGGFGDCKMVYDKLYGYWKSYIGDDSIPEPEPQRSLIDDDPF